MTKQELDTYLAAGRAAYAAAQQKQTPAPAKDELAGLRNDS